MCKGTRVVSPWEHVWNKDGGKSNLKVKDMVFTTEFAMAPMPGTWCEGCSFQCDVPVQRARTQNDVGLRRW